MKQALKKLIQSAGLDEMVGRFLFVAREKIYDIRHGTKTSGNVHLKNLKISSPNLAYGWYYEGFDPKIFGLIANELQIDHEKFELVDFGSGKGRVLFLASDYPFRKITGVEFSAELAEIARENIRRYQSATQKCRNLEVVCMDAIEFPIPAGPAVLFFNNPFGPEVMGPVLNNIQRSMEASPREIYVVYSHPRNEYLLAQNPGYRKFASGAWYVIYRCAVPDAGGR